MLSESSEGQGRILSPRCLLTQLPVPLISEARSNLFCVNFFLHALLEFDLASLEVVVAETSVNPRFFCLAVFDTFFTIFWPAFSFHAILL